MIDFKTMGAAATAGAAVASFLFREYKNKNRAVDKHNEKQDTAIHDVQDRTLVLETQMKGVEPDVSEIRAAQQRDGIRLATTEAGVAQIRGDVTEIKQMISLKLDKIPELTTALNNFGELCKTFIPKAEALVQFEAVKQRLDKLEE